MSTNIRQPAAIALQALALSLVSLLALPAQAQDPGEPRHPKLIVTDTSGVVTVLQPTGGLNDGTDDGSATAGKDVAASAGCGGSADTNWGNSVYCSVNSSTCNACSNIAYLQFSTAGMPTVNIASARVEVYVAVLHWGTCGWPYPADPVFGLRKVTSDWNEMTLDWYLQPGYDAAPLGSYTFTGVAGVNDISAYRWVSYDITGLYKAWVSGGTPNYGVRLSHDNPFCMNCDTAFFFSSDDVPPSLTYSGPHTGTLGEPMTVSATLAYAPDPTAVGARTISFTLGPQVCTGTTDVSGQASCMVTPSEAGNQTVTASFAGYWFVMVPVTTSAPVAIAGGTVTHTISASSGPGGSIAPSGSITVEEGTSQTFTIATEAGYHIADVVVDGSSVGPVGSYTFGGIVSDHTIAAAFAPDVQNPFDAIRVHLTGCVTNRGILNSLSAKLDNAEAAARRGNLTAKAGLVGAFMNEVRAQAGKKIDAACAAQLLSLAQLL